MPCDARCPIARSSGHRNEPTRFPHRRSAPRLTIPPTKRYQTNPTRNPKCPRSAVRPAHDSAPSMSCPLARFLTGSRACNSRPNQIPIPTSPYGESGMKLAPPSRPVPEPQHGSGTKRRIATPPLPFVVMPPRPRTATRFRIRAKACGSRRYPGPTATQPVEPQRGSVQKRWVTTATKRVAHLHVSLRGAVRATLSPRHPSWPDESPEPSSS
jgi:hypothetical protein